MAEVRENAEGKGEIVKLQIEVDEGNIEDGDIATGIVEMDVINNPGATLPETGGIGTTLFYVFGGVFVAFAVVMLVTKKRMQEF